MASNVVIASNFNSQKISFSPLKVLDSGGKTAYVNYDGGMFVFQTPSCALPYGMSAFDKAGPVKYSVELSLRGYDEAASKMQQFYEALQRLDDFMIEQGVRNSKQWFKAELSRDVIKAFYTPVIRLAKDKDGNPKPYPPTLKLNLKQRRDSTEFDVVCYDDKRQQYRGIPLEELLVKGAQVTSLIQCTGCWFAGSKYGLSWKLTQALLTSLPQNSRNFTFVDDGELAAPAPTPVSRKAVPKAAPAPVPAPEVVEDEEEEEEEESEADEEAPLAAPARPAPAAAAKQSVLAAVMPKPVPQPAADSLDDAADDVDPVPVPKKTAAVVKKKIVAKK
jgi:hypothetical protein